ncbi:MULTISPECIES: MarR family winged helix-turn-helix transcriptional regulator [unclassified Sphingobium]|uniref:MarR family winged helix-turn-helix transcriptional regulator n=2 Tax=Sphingobium TaxID=165695 RepID=UPI0022246C12|nr:MULTISPECIES: MarR family transcriptional regulator [unclassified Sphingobium]MCW2394020.1 MarR family transcriptional regulator for hemolysin [Sphingobium sp. B8D3B]MCW2417534.1 MarR family transcriptional regulator for hemolysin [Sphingobium sp. B8D3C]
MPGPPPARGQEPGSDADLRVQMSWWLVGTGRAWRNLLDEHLRFAGQTQPRWRVLAWARLQPGITQTELAEHMSVTSATLVAIVDELVRQGLLERRESSTDRRVKNLHLTPAAHPIIEAISQEVSDIRDALLSDVSRSELETCLSVLQRVSQAIENYGRGEG